MLHKHLLAILAYHSSRSPPFCILLLKTISPVKYSGRVWWRSAHLIFLSDSLLINAFHAECIAFKIFATISRDVFPSCAGNVESFLFGKFGFELKANWFGLKPFTFMLQKLPMIMQYLINFTIIHSFCYSTAQNCIVLFNKPITPWTFSCSCTNTYILNFHNGDIKWSLSNSPPLSTKNLLVQPKVDIHILKIFSIFFSFRLVFKQHRKHWNV